MSTTVPPATDPLAAAAVQLPDLAPLVAAIRGPLLAGERARIPGLGLFSPCQHKGCWTVMFRRAKDAPDGEHAVAVAAIHQWMAEQPELEVAGLGAFKQRKKGVVFHAHAELKDALG